MRNNFLNLSTLHNITSHYERELGHATTCTEVENIISENARQQELDFYHKIVLGIVLSGSLNSLISDAGLKLLSDNLVEINETNSTVFFQSFKECDEELKFHIVSSILSSQDSNKIQPDVLLGLKELAAKFLKTPTNPNTQLLTIQDLQANSDSIGFMPFTQDKNVILDAIKAVHEESEITCDYAKILSETQAAITPSYVVETWLNLACMERHPQIHCFNFLTALKSFDYLCLNFTIDVLFHSFRSILKRDILLMMATSYVKVFGPPFPLQSIFKLSDHPSFVLLFVDVALKTKDVFAFTDIPYTPVDMKKIYPDIGDDFFAPNWSSIEFIRMLLRLQAYDAEVVFKYFCADFAAYYSILLMGVLQQTRLKICAKTERLIKEIILYMVKTEKCCLEALKYAWSTSEHSEEMRSLIIQVLHEYYTQNFSDSKISRIVDVAHILQNLQYILACDTIAFTFELAILAAHRKYIILSEWIQKKFEVHNADLLVTMLNHIRREYPVLFSSNDGSRITYSECEKVRQNCALLDDLILFICTNRSFLTADRDLELEILISNYKTALETSPRRYSDPDKVEHAAGIVTYLYGFLISHGTYAEKKHRVDEFFEHITQFTPGQSPKVALHYIIEVLTTVKFYPYINVTDLSSAACAIARLLELNQIGQRTVLDLLDVLFSTFPVNSKYFFLGITIISCHTEIMKNAFVFSDRWFYSLFYISLPPFIRFRIEYLHFRAGVPLVQGFYTPFIDPLEGISKMSNYISDMSRRNEQGILRITCKNELAVICEKMSQSDDQSSVAASSPSFSQLCIRLFNNLSEDNIFESAKEIKQCIKREDYHWFCSHLVRERVSLQTSVHAIYKNLLDHMLDYDWYVALRRETCKRIGELLFIASDNSKKKELEMLYTLGSWLGFITLAENKPIIYKELNLKTLLFEAVLKGQNDFSRVLPLVKNILMHTRSSELFSEYNPWVVGVSSLLSEIHNSEEMRSSTKFKIEALFRAVQINYRVIPTTKYLANSDMIENLPRYLNWSEKDLDRVMFRFHIDKHQLFDYNNLDVTTQSSLLDMMDFRSCPILLLKCIQSAFIDTVEEVGTWMLDRVGQTVKEMAQRLVLNDFGKFSDESEAVQCAQTLARSVSIGYANVLLKGSQFTEFTCKIRTNIEKAVANEIDEHSLKLDSEDLKKTLYDLAQNNICIIIAFVTKSCAEKILQLINRRTFGPQDRAANERGANPPRNLHLADDKIAKNNFINQQNLSVYCEFNKYLEGFTSESSQLLDKQFVLNDAPDKFLFQDIKESDRKSLYSILYYLCKDVYSIVENQKSDPSLHGVFQLLDSIVVVVFPDNIKMLSNLIQQIVICSFDLISKQKVSSDPKYALLHELMIKYLALIRDTKIINSYLQSIATRTILEMSFDNRNNVDAISEFIYHRLVNISELDRRLSKDIETFKLQSIIHTAIELCRTFLVEEANLGVLTDYSMTHTIDTLFRIAQEPSVYDDMQSFDVQLTPEHEINGSSKSWVDKKSENDGENKTLKERGLQTETILREWVRIYYIKSEVSIDMNFKLYLAFLSQVGILKDEEVMLSFIHGCFNIMVELASQVTEMQHMLRSYQIFDAFFPFVILLVKYYGAPQNVIIPCKMSFFNKILHHVGSLFYQHTNRDKKFQPYIYQRIVTGLVDEICRPGMVPPSMSRHYFVSLLGLIHSINPEHNAHFGHSFVSIITYPHLVEGVLKYEPESKAVALYNLLLCDILRFISPFISDSKVSAYLSIISISNSLHSLFSFILQSYPGFFSYYHLELCNIIPHSCILLRNLVLSAVPRGVSSSNNSSDPLRCLPVYANFSACIPATLLKSTENYFTRKNPEFLEMVVTFFTVPAFSEYPQSYLKILNCFVYYIGESGAFKFFTGGNNVTVEAVRHSVYFELLFHFVSNIDRRCQFLLITSMVNNVRFQSAQSKVFIYLLLAIYTQSDDSIKELILRVVMERLVVQPPYPSAIVDLATFFLKSSAYKPTRLSNTSDHVIDRIFDRVQQNLGIQKVSVQ